jgi:hypothetical protein
MLGSNTRSRYAIHHHSERSQMRFFAIALVAMCTVNSAYAQEDNPFANILKTKTELKSVGTDDKVTELLKQSYNATHAEIRTRYNYWLQGVGEFDGLLDSINRFQSIRVEVEGKPDARRFAEQKVSFAKEIEKQSDTAKSNGHLAAQGDIDKRAATSFRLAAELEVERLKSGVKSDRP